MTIYVSVKKDDDPPVTGGMPMGAANGAPGPLDGSGKLPTAQLPALAVNEVYTAASQAAMLALSANVGDVAVRTDLTPHETFMLAATPASTLGNWTQLTADSGAVVVAEGYTDNSMATERARADSVYAPIGTIALTDVAAVVSANGALVVGKHNPVDATGGNKTMTLANAAAAGMLTSVEKTDSGTNTVTVTVANLRGSAGSIVLSLSRESVYFVSKADGSWWPVAGHKTLTSLDARYPVLDGVSRTFAPPSGKSVVWDAVFDNPSGYLVHLRTGATTDVSQSAAAIGIGTDLGTGIGMLISHKNTGNGFLMGGNPGAGIAYYGLQYATTSPIQLDLYVGAGALTFNMKTGIGLADGATLKPSTAFASASAALTAADIGATLTQLTSRAMNDPIGCIASSVTLSAVINTTVAAASNGVDISSASTVTLASTAGMPTTGVVAVATSAGTQIIAYTGISGAQLTGVSAGAGSLVSGTMATGGAVTQGVMSAAAGNTGWNVLFRLGGRTPLASQPVAQQKDTDGTVLWVLRKTGMVMYPSDSSKATLTVTGKSGATGNLFEVFVNGGATPVLNVQSTGKLVGANGTALSNAGQTSATALKVTTTAAASQALAVVGAASQSADLVNVSDSGGTVLSRFDKNGYFMTRKNAAPADGDLSPGDVALWLDATNGAAKLMVKARQADGTVRTGSMALA